MQAQSNTGYPPGITCTRAWNIERNCVAKDLELKYKLLPGLVPLPDDLPETTVSKPVVSC